MKPFFSIILPTYNQSTFLKKCINSITSQSFKDWELIIIDNFSNDETENIITQINDERIKLFKFKNDNIIAKSRNFGIKKAISDWISFIDTDDIWHKKKLEITKNYIEKKNADLFFHDLDFINKKFFFNNKKILDKSKSIHKPYMKHFAYNGNGIGQSSVTVKKDLFTKINFISEDKDKFSWEDFDTWLRLSMLNIEIVRIPQTLAYIWVGRENISNIERDIQNSINIKKKYIHHFKKYLEFNDKNKKLWWLEYPIILNYFRKKKISKTLNRNKNLTKSPFKIYVRLTFINIICKSAYLIKKFLRVINLVLIFKKKNNLKFKEGYLDVNYNAINDEYIKELNFNNFSIPKNFLHRIKKKNVFHYLYKEKEIICYGWSSKSSSFYVSEKDFHIKNFDSIIFYDFNTFLNYRNKGYYQKLLKTMINNYSKESCYIYATILNMRSVKSILKSGFSLFKIIFLSKKIIL